MNFKIKKDGLELRSCDKNLISVGEHTTAEIIKWTSESNCYTLAFWRKGELHFVGNRPFDVDKDIFWDLASMGQLLIDRLEE